MLYLQSQPVSTLRGMIFRLSTGAGVLSGQTFSGSEVQLAKVGGSLTNANTTQIAAITEFGSTGVYRYVATTAEIDTPGDLLFRVNKSGANVYEEVHQIDRAVFGTAATGTLSANAFTTSRTDANDFWKDALVLFHTGALAGQVKKIGAFANTGGLITLATGLAFTAAPANGDVFQILNR